MVKKTTHYRECEECGELIESGSPSTRLCKRCAAQYQNKRNRDTSRFRPKEHQNKKKRKKSKDDEYQDFYEEEFGY